MTRRKGLKGLALCVIGMVILVALVAAPAFAEPVKMTPHKIVLSGRGNADDYQAIIHIGLPSAYIVDYEVSLTLDGTLVAYAESLRYCPIDDNLLAGFDRMEIQESEYVASLAGRTVTALVEGWVTVDGVNPYTATFSGTDQVEIVAPAKGK